MEQKRLEIRIRPAADLDVPAMAVLHVRAWQVAYRGQLPDALLDGLSVSKRERDWRQIVQRQSHGPEVATIADVVVGFCDLVPARDAAGAGDVGEIAAIYIDPVRWGVGVGRALLESGIERALRLGYRALTLWVLSTNNPARLFYERLGFAPDGESKRLDRPTFSVEEVRYRRALTERGSRPLGGQAP